MADKLIRALACDEQVRIFVVKTTEMVQRAQEIHKTYPTVSAALGRVLSVASIMGSTLKNDNETLVVEINGEGALKHILVKADNDGSVKGLVSDPHVHQINPLTQKLDVGGIIGNGFLKVSRETQGVASFSSQVALQTGEIGDDFAYYYAQSEQTPSALSVGVLINADGTVHSAGAILVQLLPGADEAVTQQVEAMFKELKPVSELMADHEAMDICTSLFADVMILESHEVKYFCGCNKTQMRSVLRALSNEELLDLIAKDHQITMECHYCHTQYLFKESEIKAMIDEQAD